MDIAYLTKGSRNEPLVKVALEKSGIENDLTVDLGVVGGYNGSVQVKIREEDSKHFRTDIELADWTRFPARIRAAAAALKNHSVYGQFKITHENGVLTISLVETVIDQVNSEPWPGIGLKLSR